MPKRPRQHELETESRLAFASALGRKRVFREEGPDYGLDGSVEEFGSDGETTGLRYFVQLKATDDSDPAKSLAVPLTLDTAAYYRSLSLPVLMVRYRAPDDSLYARWFHQYDPYYGGGGETTLTFRWNPADRLDDARLDRLTAEARIYFMLRSAALGLPVTVRLDAPEAGAYGRSRSELLFALRSAEQLCGDIVRVQRHSPQDCIVRVEPGADQLRVSLSEATSATAHLQDSYDPGEAAERFTADAMVLAAIAFNNAGHTDIAARLTTGFFVASSLVDDLEVGLTLSASFDHSRRLHDSLRLAAALAEAGERDASLRFILPTIHHQDSLEPDELEAFEQVMHERANRALDAGMPIEAARDLHNVGNVLRGWGRDAAGRAADAFEAAVRHDPKYEQRDYFQRQLGGALFVAERFEEALTAYRRAAALAPDAFTTALAADAALFAGRYAEAYDLFAQANAEPHDGIAEHRLKERFAGLLVDDLGLTMQRRDQAQAATLLDGIDPTHDLGKLEAMYREALEGDALFGVIWFNRGRAHLDLNDTLPALDDYLAAALCLPRDGEAWANALALSMMHETTLPLVDAILDSALTRAPDSFRSHLALWARAQGASFPVDALLSGVDEYFEEHLRSEPAGLLLRTIDEDGEVTEAVVGVEHAEE
jgi:tetratricopeptide (TPR) repeat protein